MPDAEIVAAEEALAGLRSMLADGRARPWARGRVSVPRIAWERQVEELRSRMSVGRGPLTDTYDEVAPEVQRGRGGETLSFDGASMTTALDILDAALADCRQPGSGRAMLAAGPAEPGGLREASERAGRKAGVWLDDHPRAAMAIGVAVVGAAVAIALAGGPFQLWCIGIVGAVLAYNGLRSLRAGPGGLRGQVVDRVDEVAARFAAPLPLSEQGHGWTPRTWEFMGQELEELRREIERGDWVALVVVAHLLIEDMNDASVRESSAARAAATGLAASVPQGPINRYRMRRLVRAAPTIGHRSLDG